MPSDKTYITNLDDFPSLNAVLQVGEPTHELMAGLESGYHVKFNIDEEFRDLSILQLLSLFGRSDCIDAMGLSVEHINQDVKADVYLAIRYAAINGYTDTIECLFRHLTKEEKNEAVRHDEYYVILTAAAYGYTDTIKYLFRHLTEEEKNKAVKHDEYLAITCAAQRGQTDTIKYLFCYLKEEEQKECVTIDGYYAIACAAESGHIDTIQYFESHLIREEKIQAVTMNAYHLIQLAAKGGHTDTLEYLFRQLTEEEKNEAVTMNGYHLIQLAAKGGHTDTLEYLFRQLTEEEKNEAVYIYYYRAIRAAAEYGHSETVKYLESFLSEAERNEKDKKIFVDSHGNSPLSWLSRWSDVKEMILDFDKARINALPDTFWDRYKLVGLDSDDTLLTWLCGAPLGRRIIRENLDYFTSEKMTNSYLGPAFCGTGTLKTVLYQLCECTEGLKLLSEFPSTFFRRIPKGAWLEKDQVGRGLVTMLSSEPAGRQILYHLNVDVFASIPFEVWESSPVTGKSKDTLPLNCLVHDSLGMRLITKHKLYFQDPRLEQVWQRCFGVTRDEGVPPLPRLLKSKEGLALLEEMGPSFMERFPPKVWVMDEMSALTHFHTIFFSHLSEDFVSALSDSYIRSLIQGDSFSESAKESLRQFFISVGRLKDASPKAQSDAQCSHGILAMRGGVGTMNFSLAAKYLSLATKGGNKKAGYHLGLLYLRGHGVTASKAEAKRLFQFAEDEMPEAKARLALLAPDYSMSSSFHESKPSFVFFYWAGKDLPGRCAVNLKRWSRRLQRTYFLPVLLCSEDVYNEHKERTRCSSLSDAKERFPKWSSSIDYLEKDCEGSELLFCVDEKEKYERESVMLNMESYFKVKGKTKESFRGMRRLFKAGNAIGIHQLVKNKIARLFMRHLSGFYFDIDLTPKRFLYQSMAQMQLCMKTEESKEFFIKHVLEESMICMLTKYEKTENDLDESSECFWDVGMQWQCYPMPYLDGHGSKTEVKEAAYCQPDELDKTGLELEAFKRRVMEASKSLLPLFHKLPRNELNQKELGEVIAAMQFFKKDKEAYGRSCSEKRWGVFGVTEMYSAKNNLIPRFLDSHINQLLPSQPDSGSVIKGKSGSSKLKYSYFYLTYFSPLIKPVSIHEPTSLLCTEYQRLQELKHAASFMESTRTRQLERRKTFEDELQPDFIHGFSR